MTSLRSSNSRLWGQPLQCLHLPIQVDKHINENFPGSWFCYVGLTRMTLFYLLCRWHEEDEACWCDTKCPGDHHGRRPNCMYASWIWLTCSVIAHIIVIGTSVWASGFCNITLFCRSRVKYGGQCNCKLALLQWPCFSPFATCCETHLAFGYHGDPWWSTVIACIRWKALWHV